MFFILFPAIIVLADQLFKYWITSKLAEGGTIVLIKGLIHLTYEENTGAAFSILSDMRWLLIVLASIGILAIIYILLTHKGGFAGKLGLAAVLGGAIGNLIDRVVLGYVVDMFSFDFMSFAIFNVADIFITIGGIIFILDYLIPVFKRSKKGKQPVKSQERSARPEREAPAKAAPPVIPIPTRPMPQEPVIRPAPVKAEKPAEPVIEESPKYSETSILEEYDLERLLAEYRSEYDND